MPAHRFRCRRKGGLCLNRGVSGWERWKDVVVEGGWGQRETDPSIRGYNEREQLPAAGSDSTQMWGCLKAQQSRGGTLESLCHDLILIAGAPIKAPSHTRLFTGWRQRPSMPQTHLRKPPYKHSGWVYSFCCLGKIWPTWWGAACQRLISASPALPGR